MNIWIDTRYCSWFIHLRRPIFPMNHNSGSWCLQSRSHLGLRMRVLVLHLLATSHPICDLSRIIATWQFDALTVPSTHYIFDNCIYFQSHLLAGVNSIAIDVMTMKYWFFLSIGHQQSAISSCWLVIAGDCTMTLAFHVPQKTCRIKISLKFISTFGHSMTLLFEYLICV